MNRQTTQYTVSSENVFTRTNQESASVGLVCPHDLSSRINRHNASSKIVLQEAEERMSSLEQIFFTDPSAANASFVTLQSRLTDQLHFEKAKQKVFLSKQCIFEHGEHAHLHGPS